MVLIVKLISIIVILYGCLAILRPDTLKKIIGYFKKDNKIYYAAGTKLILGIIMMAASKYCSIPWIILFFGALSVFGGAMSFILKKPFILKIIDWWEKNLLKNVYLVGIGILLVGVLLALAA